jgi:multicomponent Na+:H+ antiporter subunit G
METTLEILKMAAEALLAAPGLALMLAGAVGLLRFPDVFTRAHAALVSDALGGALVVAGLAVEVWGTSLSPRLGLLALLLLIAAPVLTHLVVAAAHAGGLSPLVGPFAAPPRSAKREGRAS